MSFTFLNPIAPTIPGPLTITPGGLSVAGAITAGSSPGGPLPELVASTGVAGFALQNATPTILTWNVPNDGNQHRFACIGSRNTTVAETGGQVSLTFTPPGGGAAVNNVVAAGGSGVGNGGFANPNQGYTVAPGTTVTLAQTSALTLGACTINAELWGS